jgi:hypothetical protein
MFARSTGALIFIAAIGSGLVAGVFFAFSSFVMPALARIRPEHGIVAMQSINLTVINPGFDRDQMPRRRAASAPGPTVPADRGERSAGARADGRTSLECEPRGAHPRGARG